MLIRKRDKQKTGNMKHVHVHLGCNKVQRRPHHLCSICIVLKRCVVLSAQQQSPMATAEANTGMRLFAVPKKHCRKPAVHAQHAADTASAVREVSGAEEHAPPTPAGLTSSPSSRGEHVNGAQQQQPTPAAAAASLGKQSRQPMPNSQSAGPAAHEPPEGKAAASAAAESSGVAAGKDEAQPAPLPAANTTFRALGVSEWLDRVCRSLGMTQPTQVQAGCIPAILAGRNAIGTAHTGSGKTAAFALPILQLLAADPFGIFALVLTPTRFSRGSHTGLSVRKLLLLHGQICVNISTCIAWEAAAWSAGSWRSSWQSSSARWALAWRSKIWSLWAVWICTSRRASWQDVRTSSLPHLAASE
jgi:DEAD/DEAH box helicase